MCFGVALSRFPWFAPGCNFVISRDKKSNKMDSSHRYENEKLKVFTWI